MNKNSLLFARVGAGSYFIWSVLHLQAAHAVYKLAMNGPASMIQGRLLQDAWNLLAFSVAAVATAVILNWRNSALGYWINAGVVGVADMGFILFILLPGHVPIWPGVVGPVLWLVGLIFTTLGLIGRGRVVVN